MPHTNLIVAGEQWPSASDLTRLLPQDWLWAYYQREVKKNGWRGWQRAKAHSNRAMRMGTHTHGFVEMALTRKSYIPYLDEARTIREPERRIKLVKAWAKALVETTQKDTIQEIEIKLIGNNNNNLKEHGTCDAIVLDDEIGMKVIDWKTSGSIGIDYPLQLAIYARIWNTTRNKLIHCGEIQRVDKELKSAKARASGEHHVQVKVFNNLEQYYPVIDALHIIYDYVNKQGVWKSKEKASAEA